MKIILPVVLAIVFQVGVLAAPAIPTTGEGVQQQGRSPIKRADSNGLQSNP
ncbi:hypothetical protein Pst134EA_013365 [Puccinia striiformis f. sp. tritici]|uniref:hypothetical protein n=1 Tax=Puccinia striiformis f. sp. tritici TaxID=168172 RepID=UPI002007FE4C|nr:hypothetical protein Pst134EA_013329 [Puccinia striiformis f. sp. tritici]XP_047806205.1 hypothetical protein Pst134EA_013365 [Puccinia striiformis f. sp. tritici]KAI9603739.1 hypothetical protein H4Q26_003338 [Puccinia striiformis f. sp. tritici PST-130]KAH9454237.1 hypothetical protein Pst134EB_014330 [Puccinia striiformis f. sp. tritici]KAH9465445.1 hypothetical protein Pst134EA_013329 [Puccinia striiformis f. sp. tritici]KAH9465484.1 hypothetical protein Pst134EA_013365 [Puccinia striif